MPRVLKICNLNFEGYKNFDEFEIGGYTFLPVNKDIKEESIYKNQDSVHCKHYMSKKKEKQ